MGLFDIFKRPKSEADKATQELGDRLFPGGAKEIEFKAKATMHLCNGKLDLGEAAHLCWELKSRVFFSVTKFDGRNNLGPDVDRLLQQAQENTKGKLTTAEAAAVLFYLVFDKQDPGLETQFTLKKYFEGAFGSDALGCETDAIPSALGEFGLDVTNPIPVRGVASNDLYLDSLRTNDGRKVNHKRLRAVEAPNITGNIDEYEISQDGRTLCNLYISPYNKRVSERPPKGFILFRQD